MKIAICGSMVFSDQMLAAKKFLEGKGHTAFTSSFLDHYLGKSVKDIEAVTDYDKQNHDAIREYWDVINESDAILVLNYDRRGIANYIGGNTLMELGFAYVLKKKIFLLNPIPEIAYYKSEIEAVKPIILNGDLDAIR